MDEIENINIKRDNKALKIIGNIGFTIFMTFMLLMIIIVGQSRITGQEPSLFGHRIYIVESGSMVPTLPIGSMIIIKETPASEIQKNDVVTYYSTNGDVKITHRIVEVKANNEGFLTRGDANNTEDASVLKGDRVIGKLALMIPYIGTIFGILNGKIGIILIILLAGMWIMIPRLLKKFA